jgi:DHA1 family inner membrane transport protein
LRTHKIEREWRFILATFAASGVGYLGSAAAPIIVSALLVHGLNYQQAGDLGTIELTTLALASTLITPFVPRLSHRKLAVGGTLLTLAGLAVSAMSTSYGLMVLGRIMTGAGSGFAISGVNAAVAARADAERIFAIIWTLGGGMTAALAVQLPGVVEGGAYPLGFGVLFALCAIGLPMMFWLPPRPVFAAASVAAPRPDSGDDPQPSGEATPGPGRERLRDLFGPLPLMALLGIFVYSLAEMALWNFAYSIPAEAGVPEDELNWILGFTTLMGLAGGAFAAWLGVRSGRVFPLVAGSCVSAIGRWVYLESASSEALIVGGLLWGLGFYFVSPYQIGLMAACDRWGRLAVAGGGMLNFGYALGPGIAGRTLQHLDLSVLLVVIVGATFVSMLLMLPLAIRVDRAEPVSSRVTNV